MLFAFSSVAAMGPAPNLLGIDVARLDVAAFLAAARTLYPCLALAWLLALLRRKRASWLLLGVLAANAYAFLETSYPLQRLYALGLSDRNNNLGMCQAVAAGHSPLETWQVGQTHFDPHGRPHNILWVALVAALSGFNPDRVFSVYAFLPIGVIWGFVLALYFGLGPETPSGGWSPWELAILAGFATLLASGPLDFLGIYRVPWAMTFLLKPNHALGLVVLPLLLRSVASIRTWRGCVGAGLLLQLLAWVFVLHAAYGVVGLLCFALLAVFLEGRSARCDVRDVLGVLAINAVLVAPAALWILFRLSGPRPQSLVPDIVLPYRSPHLLEPTLRAGWVFLLGLYGAWVAWQRDRLGRLLAAQLVGAWLLWAAYLLLSALRWAEQSDELYYWLRFLTAAVAGIGAWDLVGRLGPALLGRSLQPALRAFAVGLLALPSTLPYWWNPARMDSYFTKCREPLPAILRDLGEFLRNRTDPQAVFAGDPYFAVYAAALSGRRSLTSMGLPQPPDLARRAEVERTLMRSKDPESVWAAAASYGVTHLAVTPLVLSTYGLTLADFEARPFWERVALFGEPGQVERDAGLEVPLGDFVAILRLVHAPAR